LLHDERYHAAPHYVIIFIYITLRRYQCKHNTFLCISGRHAPKKLELDNPSRQQTRKTPTRERKRVRYLQISYQYHLSPRRRHDFPCGPAGRGLRRCCHGTSCKKRADYTRLMYLSQPDQHYYNSTTRIMHVIESPDGHTCFTFYSPQPPSIQQKY